MKEVFEQIALEENAQLQIASDKHMAPSLHSGVGGTIFTTVYTLDVEYKGYLIKVVNELGGQDVASVVCELPEQPNHNELEIMTKGGLFQIFSPKHLLCFSVKSRNQNLKASIESSNVLFRLGDLVKSTRFDPITIGKNRDGLYKLSMHYHLLFKERENVVRPIIDFYKQLINYLG